MPDFGIQLSLKDSTGSLLNIRGDTYDEFDVNLKSLFGIGWADHFQAQFQPGVPGAVAQGFPGSQVQQPAAAPPPAAQPAPVQQGAPPPVQAPAPQPAQAAAPQQGPPCGICGLAKVWKTKRDGSGGWYGCNNWNDDFHKQAKASGGKE